MSRFSIEETSYEGNPVIEVLKDGKPFWYDHPEYKQHFRFGVKKAITLLLGFNLVNKFWQTDGEEPDINTQQDGGVKYEYHQDDFPFGKTIELYKERYAREVIIKVRGATTIPPKEPMHHPKHLVKNKDTAIRIGVEKCCAIVEFKQEILNFVRNNM